MEPIVNGLESEFEDQIVFLSVDANTEEGRTMMSEYGLRGHPSYAIVDVDGSLLWTAAGQLPAEQLRQSLVDHSTRQ
jgi:protein-disulfide isomerase-like protein with CxxC motif